MTFMDLEDALLAEVEDVLSGIITHTADGTEKVGIKGYAHDLPPMQTDEDDYEDYDEDYEEPRYKYFANRFLTKLQNFVFKKGLSEYHSGYRAYSKQIYI